MNQENQDALFGMSNKQLGLLLGLMGVLVIGLVMINSQAQTLAQETVAQGEQTSQEEQKLIAVNSASEWESEIPSDTREEVEDIDFQNQTVIAAFAGQKSTGGYGIQIESIEQENSDTTVNVLMTEPEEGCSVTTVITYPYHIVTTEKVTGSVNFNTRTETRSC